MKVLTGRTNARETRMPLDWARSNQGEVKKKEEEEEGKEEVLKMMSQGGDMTVDHGG